MSDSIKLKPVFKNTIFMGGGDYQQGFEDGKSAGFAEGEAYGKANAPTEDLSVTLTSNGTYSYEKPQDKYYADVAINVNVPSEKTPTQEKSKTITKNGTEVIIPDDGYALSKITVVTQIPERLPTQTKTIDIDENGTDEVTADSGYALEKVIINTDIDTRLPEQEKSLEVTENKTYEVTPDDGYALKKVTVTGNVASSGGGDDDSVFDITTYPPSEWAGLHSSANSGYVTCGIKSIRFKKTFEPSKVADFFRNFPNVEKIEGLNFIDLSKVNSISSFFTDCGLVTSLDLSSWNTENILTMDYLFNKCQSLKSINLSNFNTSKVTKMNNMFYLCKALKSLDLSNFDTSEVTNMGSMFCGNILIPTLDLSNFDTSEVTNMNGMFRDCDKLTTLDLSSFDTSKVTNMNDIFANDGKLENVIFGNNWASNKSIALVDCYYNPLSKASILDLANKIADKSDTTIYTGTYKVRVKDTQKALFSEEELTELANQFTAKNWTLVFGW